MIRIVFDTEYELVIDLYDSDFVRRWQKLLKDEIVKNSLLQDHSFSSFASEIQARQYLEQAIVTVNKFLKHEVVSMPTLEDYSNPNFYNQLHQDFEKLAGSSWDVPTRIMQIAPQSVKIAIKSINRWCHRLERQPYQLLNYFRLEFDTYRREQLLLQDYDLFQPISTPNAVTLDYSTLGKSLRDCFADNLTPDYDGMKIQHHYAANFICNTTTDRKVPAGFVEWCRDYGINSIPQSELGSIMLGTIVDSNWYDKVKKACKIEQIILE